MSSSRGHARIVPKPKRQRQLALRRVARPAVDRLCLGARRARQTHHRAQTALVRGRPNRTHAQPLVAIAAVIAEERRSAVERRHHEIEIAVAVEIQIRAAPTHDRSC